MADWVAVVDDDITNLKTAGRMLSNNNIGVSAFRSAGLLLDFLREGGRPDLILLDIIMPECDGYEALERVRILEKELKMEETPIIFLTADENEDAETKGLALGAMDFIKKPFIPDVLLMRVRHIIELVRLQRDLSSQVEIKTNENKELLLQVIQAITDTLDAKDTYTNGHSRRVAEYSKEIAKRYGYSEKQLSEMYMMALLHDVGKIGIPDEYIHKAASLSDAEFEVMKSHPLVGAKILENIKAMPRLAVGARSHHERYGGGGYPYGIKGSEIPEEARIIAVADAYDTMSSYRSYRDKLPQSKVRSEIERGKGTQFDPVFADIMLEMIDEDKDYLMSEIR